MTMQAETVVRHVALVKWKPAATPEQIRAAQGAFAGFVPHMPGYLGHHVAANLGIDVVPELSWDFAYVADFRSVDDFRAYQAHPMHIEYGQKFVHAAREDSRRVQLFIQPQQASGRDALIRHIVLVQWQPGTDAGRVRDAVSAFPAMAEKIPGLIRYTVGPNLGIDSRPDLNWDFAFVIDFDNVAAVKGYWASAHHSTFADHYVKPYVLTSRRVQCEWPG